MDEVNVLSRGQMNVNLEDSEKSDNMSTKNIHEADFNVQPLDGISKVNILSRENRCDENSNRKKKKRRKSKKAIVKDEAQKEMDARLTGNLDEENVTIEKPRVSDELQCLGQTQMNTEPTENFADGDVIIENAKTQDEAQNIDRQEMDTLEPAENLAQRNVNGKRRKKRKKTKKAKVDDEVCSEMDTRSTENIFDGNIVIMNPKIQDEAQCMHQKKMDTLKPAENLAQGKVNGKRRKKRKKTKKAKVDDEVCSEMDTRSTENIFDGNTVIMNPKIQDEAQCMDQNKMDVRRPAENLSQGNAPGTQRKKRKKKKGAKFNNEVHSETHARSTENLTEGNGTINKLEIKDENQNVSQVQIHNRSTETVAEGNMTIKNPKSQVEVQSMNQAKMDGRPTLNFAEGNVTVKRKRKRRKTKKAKTLDEGISRSAISTCNSFALKDAEALCLKAAPISSFRRKLLVLDINGLLADIVCSSLKQCKGDIRICGRAVYKRPFCDDFLKFCFHNFEVGIWSSRSKKIIDKVVNYLLEDQKRKLQFCWDLTHSTQTGFRTLENHYKPLVCKELRKIWENDDPNCPWKKGAYDESNTLLLDDSPYKALLNPLHTAIFPCPYQYSHIDDNSLGPGGDLRVYLEGLVTCEHVQKYVEQHPFGERPINEQHLSWGFYKQVLEKMSNPVKGRAPIPS